MHEKHYATIKCTPLRSLSAYSGNRVLDMRGICEGKAVYFFSPHCLHNVYKSVVLERACRAWHDASYKDQLTKEWKWSVQSIVTVYLIANTDILSHAYYLLQIPSLPSLRKGSMLLLLQPQIHWEYLPYAASLRKCTWLYIIKPVHVW